MIKFGTDGWRGIIASDFTFKNVRLVTAGIVNYIKNEGLERAPLVVGYDNRFQSEDFAMVCARVIGGSGIKVYLSKEACPSPAISFAVKTYSAAGGIMVTASHNPPIYNGLKFKAHYAGSADDIITKKIEEEINKNPLPSEGNESKIEYFEPKEKYFEHLKSLVDLDLIRGSKIRILVDPMNGSAAGYMGHLLPPIKEINSNRDPLFSQRSPEPLPPNLEDLTSIVRETALRFRGDLVVGFAFDGDGDRIAAIDSTGAFINPHNIFSIILKHLVENRGMKGEIVKTFNISQMIDLQAKKYNLPLHITPIGFKHICNLMLKRDILIGGEESGGIGIKGHIPERDSILCALLLIQAISYQKSGLGEILDDLTAEFGSFYYDRADIKIDEEKKKKIMQDLLDSPPKNFSGRKVSKVETLDGVKLNLDDGSWVLFRPSGTEPLLRIYVEANTDDKVKRILAEGEKLLS